MPGLYLAATLRMAEETEPGELSIFRGLKRIPVATTSNRCDHTSRVCPTKACVETWSYDWLFHFDRTRVGRELFSPFEALGR